QEYVLRSFNAGNANKLLFHNYQRAAAIVDLIEMIGKDVSTEVIEIAKIAAWLQGIGYLDDFKNPHNSSVTKARTFLKSQNYPEVKSNRVLNAILNARTGGTPMSQTDELLSDAITAHDFTIDFFDKNPLKRVEEELVLGEKVETIAWEQLQLSQLLEAKFFTPQGKVTFEPQLAQNILTQKQISEKGRAKTLQKLEDDEENQLRLYQNVEKKIPRSAIQTFFRSSYRSHIHLSMIADNKANIMISVNAIVISLLISVLTYQDITTLAPQILLPVVTFLITGLTSLVFAILAVRPKVTQLNDTKTPKKDLKKNIIFFGNFVNLQLEEYEEAMDAMMREGELMYGNMVRDLYFLGKVLDKKYRYLTNSYNIFMVGFVATVLIFLAFIFLQ
ncbi:MAG: Pycsar system effector family protein, partial [Bacteroidota bacterium]